MSQSWLSSIIEQTGAAGEAQATQAETGDRFVPPKVTRNSKGELTNGAYVLNKTKMRPHVEPTQGKSLFLHKVNAEQAVLDAAAFADQYDLWEVNPDNPNAFPSKAKVPVLDGAVGVLGDGGLTNTINVYRKKTGQVHGTPGHPQHTKEET